MQIQWMDGWPANCHGDGCGMFDIIMNKYKLKNDINGWMDRHGDGYRQGLDNNEYKKRMQLK